jgi:hypothetical protein
MVQHVRLPHGNPLSSVLVRDVPELQLRKAVCGGSHQRWKPTLCEQYFQFQGDLDRALECLAAVQRDVVHDHPAHHHRPAPVQCVPLVVRDPLRCSIRRGLGRLTKQLPGGSHVPLLHSQHGLCFVCHGHALSQSVQLRPRSHDGHRIPRGRSAMQRDKCDVPHVVHVQLRHNVLPLPGVPRQQLQPLADRAQQPRVFAALLAVVRLDRGAHHCSTAGCRHSTTTTTSRIRRTATTTCGTSLLLLRGRRLAPPTTRDGSA